MCKKDKRVGAIDIANLACSIQPAMTFSSAQNFGRAARFLLEQRTCEVADEGCVSGKLEAT